MTGSSRIRNIEPYGMFYKLLHQKTLNRTLSHEKEAEVMLPIFWQIPYDVCSFLRNNYDANFKTLSVDGTFHGTLGICFREKK